MEEIGTDRIDSLVLSLPDKMFSHDDLPKEIMMPLWAAVQKSIENQKVASAGLSDFNARYLEQLCEALEDKKVSPSSPTRSVSVAVYHYDHRSSIFCSLAKAIFESSESHVVLQDARRPG